MLDSPPRGGHAAGSKVAKRPILWHLHAAVVLVVLPVVAAGVAERKLGIAIGDDPAAWLGFTVGAMLGYLCRPRRVLPCACERPPRRSWVSRFSRAGR